MAAATAQGTYINPMAALASQIPHAALNGMPNPVVPPTSGKKICCYTFFKPLNINFSKEQERGSRLTEQCPVYHRRRCQISTWPHKRRTGNQVVQSRFIQTEYLKRIQLVSTSSPSMCAQAVHHTEGKNSIGIAISSYLVLIHALLNR